MLYCVIPNIVRLNNVLQKMELPLRTFNVWKVEIETLHHDFLEACALLLSPGDVAVFGAYEPTPKLTEALLSVGAIQHSEIREFYSSFEVNRSEHPNGCAFEYTLGNQIFSEVLTIPKDVLRQSDIPSFYDHFLAYRPGTPRIPLISFHDAACGGALYLSELYTKEAVTEFAARLGVTFSEARNPVYRNYKYVEPDR